MTVNASSVCIVVPTFNERDNIASLIDAIAAIRNERLPLSVLVVDDSSPDGTSQRVRELQPERPWLHLLVRAEKSGLGAAYKAGMQHAIDALGAEIVFEMDADLSHDPVFVPAMLERIENGADFVIGSRYVEGGRLPEHWPRKRRIISWMANTGARTVLRLQVRDCSGGFRAVRCEVLERVGLESIAASGYGFQIELLYRAVASGSRVDEVPIVFADRTSGTSKMRLADWWEMARLVFTLRFTRSPSKSVTSAADS